MHKETTALMWSGHCEKEKEKSGLKQNMVVVERERQASALREKEEQRRVTENLCVAVSLLHPFLSIVTSL